MRVLLCALVAVMLAWQPALAADGARRSLQIILDNSAAIQDAGAAETFKRQLLFHVTEMRKRPELRGVRVHVVSTNNARNLWVGTPQELFRNGAVLLSQIAVVKNGCADLVGALEQVKLNLELEQPDSAAVYIFSSLIHTGAPCDKVAIELPQAAPKMNLSFLAKENISVRFLWVHHLQMRPWLEAIKSANLKARIHDEESSKAILKKGLEP